VPKLAELCQAERNSAAIAVKKAGCALGGKRGRMSSLSKRQTMVQWITEAIASGTKKHQACNATEISTTTLLRWWSTDSVVDDQHPCATRLSQRTNYRIQNVER